MRPAVVMPRTVASLMMKSTSTSRVVRRERCSRPASLSMSTQG